MAVWTSVKLIFDICDLLILHNEDCCCKYITGGVTIHFYTCVSLLVPVCAACVFVCVCDIKSDG